MSKIDFWENRKLLEQSGVVIPNTKKNSLRKEMLNEPKWVHFGGGNLYRAFHAEIAQNLVEQGELTSGVIVCETYDEEIIDEMYQPYDNNFIEVIMHENGNLEKKLITVTTESYFCHPIRSESYLAMKQVFKNASLQIVTVTITEKGYTLTDSSGNYTDIVKKDMQNGPDETYHTMGIIASLLYARYQANKAPIAMISTDNFSKNGFKFQQAVVTIVEKWVENKIVEKEFAEYLKDNQKVSFPWTMIDRITPNPSEVVAKKLGEIGIDGIEIRHTKKHTNIATFSNTEEVNYLVIEDNFPNGCPDLAKAGVILTNRETVDKADAMKVTTCLNPLHTTLAIYGCLLNYVSIAEEMKDPEIVALIKGIGYLEGLLVVDDPHIINPKRFIDELLTKRLPNPWIPDTPQRIATDTSQKVGIRYGETIRKYWESETYETTQLVYIPLAIAGWLRYLIGVDDKGQPILLSPDPLLGELQINLKELSIGKTDKLHEAVRPILSNPIIFGVDLYQVGLGNKIEGYLKELLEEVGAIRKTLKKYTDKEGK